MLRKQLKDTRLALNNMASRFTQEIATLKALARMAQKANGVTRDHTEALMDEVTGVLQAQFQKLTLTDEKLISVDDWARDLANRAAPDAFWYDQ